MEFGPQDQAIVRLLTALKQVDDEYPENMLVAQRRSFLKRMTEIQPGIHAEKGFRNTVHNTNPTHGSSASSTLLETALIVTIVAEASVMAYFHREKMTDFFETLTAGVGVQEVTHPPVVPTSLEVQGIRPSPAIASTSRFMTATEGSAGITITSTGTPMPGNPVDSSTTVDASQPVLTPLPGADNGNHYGQTPEPERTKDNHGNNDKPRRDKEDKPPKDKDTSPEDKPPKDK